MNLIIPDRSNPHASIVRNLSNTAWAFAKVQIKRRGECLHEYSVFSWIYIYIYMIFSTWMLDPHKVNPWFKASPIRSTCFFKISPGGQRWCLPSPDLCSVCRTRCRHKVSPTPSGIPSTKSLKYWAKSEENPAGMTGKPSWVKTSLKQTHGSSDVQWIKDFFWRPGEMTFTGLVFSRVKTNKKKQTNGQCIPGLGLRYAPHPWWSFDAGAAHDWKEPFPMRMSLAWLEFTVSLW